MRNLDKIDHLVVLMLENRSFDAMLGYLYESDTPAQYIGFAGPFDGVAVQGEAAKNLSCPAPDGTSIPVAKAPWQSQREMCNPFPDPGEEFSPHVNTQIYGMPLPAPTDLATMRGFVSDYYMEVMRQSVSGAPPSLAEYGLIMNCFTPEAVPVLSTLAREFAVSDRWFCSVPSQTFCNRSFVHSAQSSGFVTNSNYVKWTQNTSPTILSALSDKNVPWNVYYDPEDLASATRGLHPAFYSSRYNANFRPFSDFLGACQADALPAYSFIEPRLFLNHNDQHPPSVINLLVDSSVLAGEQLIKEVYDAIICNPRVWERTLLVILYDEHGGTYDHVAPPAATPPRTGAPAGECGFKFDRFGVRVPAVFVSPWIAKGTVVRAPDAARPFDHTSLIKTICEKWGTSALTQRDAAAPSIEPVLSLPAPRTDCPVVNARPYIKAATDVSRALPISAHQQHVLGLISNALNVQVPNEIRHVGDAIDHIASAVQSWRARI